VQWKEFTSLFVESFSSGGEASGSVSPNKFSFHIRYAVWSQRSYLSTLHVEIPSLTLFIQNSSVKGTRSHHWDHSWRGSLTSASFPELAAELKFKIWEYTFPEPRTITLKQKSRPHWDSNIHKIIHFSFGTCDEPPKLILLQVNREAREFTREKYQRRFLTVCG
jgi:hypothetical protein